MAPSGVLASSGYCLANPGKEYLVYIPDDQPVTLDLTNTTGTFRSTWIHTLDGSEKPGPDLEGGVEFTLNSPYQKGEAVLHVKR
jgi:hypothetical protein